MGVGVGIGIGGVGYIAPGLGFGGYRVAGGLGFPVGGVGYGAVGVPVGLGLGGVGSATLRSNLATSKTLPCIT